MPIPNASDNVLLGGGTAGEACFPRAFEIVMCDPSEVDAEVDGRLAEADLVGEQKHLSAERKSARPRQGN